MMKRSLPELLLKLELAKHRVSQLEQQLLGNHSGTPEEGVPAAANGDLRSVFNSSEDLIWFADLDNRIVLANDATVHLFKTTRGLDVCPGTAVAALFPPDQVDFIEHAFEMVKHGKTLRTNYPGDNKREYSAKIQPVREGARIIGVSVFARDITRTHDLEEELRRYEQIIASSPNLIALIDRNHCFQMANDAYLNAFSKKRQFLIGTHIRQLIGEDAYLEFTQPILARAFQGEHVQIDRWIDCPGLGLRYFAVSYHPLHSQRLQPQYVVINASDISALKRAENDRQRIFDLSLDMLSISTMEGEFIETNPAWSRTLGWSETELRQKTWLDLVVAEDHSNSLQVAERLRRKESVVGFENRCRCKDGSQKWLAWSCYPDPERERIFSTVRDITDRKRMVEDLLQLATTDPLTGAGNRRHFIDRAATELARSRRYGSQMAVLMFDIDYFKEVNDTYGHDVGDEVLKRLVDCCHQELREIDIFGRYGGEEFAALLVNTSKARALQVCERLLKAISLLKISAGEATVSITVSLGLTLYRAADDSIDILLKRADDALYQAKNTGRNQIVCR